MARIAWAAGAAPSRLTPLKSDAGPSTCQVDGVTLLDATDWRAVRGEMFHARGLLPRLSMRSVRVPLSPANRLASSDAGDTAMSGGGSPTPVSGTASRLWSGSFDWSASCPLHGLHGDPGANRSVRTVVSRGTSEIGSVPKASEKADPDMLPAVMCSGSEPSLINPSVRSRLWPTSRVPKSRVIGLTVRFGTPSATRRTGTSSCGALGSLVAIARFARYSPPINPAVL